MEGELAGLYPEAWREPLKTIRPRILSHRQAVLHQPRPHFSSANHHVPPTTGLLYTQVLWLGKVSLPLFPLFLLII